jgi:hypothetical protein
MEEPEREATDVPRVCEWRTGVQAKARRNQGTREPEGLVGQLSGN